MSSNPIAKVYWRTIKRGTRAFSSVPVYLQTDVKRLATTEVEINAITPIEYEDFIGEPYREA